MYKIDFTHPCHIHFIGIGGISMSGLAAVLNKEGFKVTGSDSRKSKLTEQLEQRGVRIEYPQKADNIHPDFDVVVYTAAIHPDNPEFSEAVRQKKPMLTRAQLLGQIMDNYKNSIAISGTHGKTTTTSMLSCIQLQAGLDPTISVGGILKEIDGNIRLGDSDNFITEACEYTNSFLSLYPKIGLILNIDADHLDFFKDLDDIRRSFHHFASNIRKDGCLVINGAIPRLSEITDGIGAKIVTYGTPDSDYYPADISYDEHGIGSFSVMHEGKKLGHFRLEIPGEHNILNATAAVAVSDLCGISMDDVREGLLSFGGADRRFQIKGQWKGATVIDDYAHHPTEIKATLKAAGNYPHNKIWCIFQPHTYTRTKALMNDFAEALTMADTVVLADIYVAREKDNLGISSDTLRQNIANLGTDAYYFPSFAQIEDFLSENVAEGDLVITMGAGDIVKVGEDLLRQEKA